MGWGRGNSVLLEFASLQIKSSKHNFIHDASQINRLTRFPIDNFFRQGFIKNTRQTGRFIYPVETDKITSAKHFSPNVVKKHRRYESITKIIMFKFRFIFIISNYYIRNITCR